ncbi:uncharacterized protein LOC100116759 [Nasonia vitripennis]|uniref:Juvenile hormone esterase binding protein n=1 Tax=Nasonia vitripennis TaxID=7425 RepID=A0A7M7LRD8_NASVI|nr:uncharacterized protein LOC100116759 [Nasonia vitripennis]
MLLKGFQQTILQINSNYLSVVIRSKSTKSIISNCLARRTKLLRRITSSQSILQCRKNHNDAPNEVRLPALTDDAPVIWPSFFRTLSNFIQCNFVIKPYMDNDFNLPDFLDGTKQALSVVSSALAREDYDSIQDLVDKETLAKTRQKISTLTAEQKQLIEIHKDDIYLTFPYQVGIMFDNDDKANQRFVEIMVIFHSLRGLKRMRAENKEPPLNMGLLPEYQKLMFICNYRFIREYTKGVESSWTVNLINHFMPVNLSK